jgi:hypothetical protein
MASPAAPPTKKRATGRPEGFHAARGRCVPARARRGQGPRGRRRDHGACFVAVNIDGARTVDVGPREEDGWIFDRRLAEEAQMGGWLYDDNDFDRGPLFGASIPSGATRPRRLSGRRPTPSSSRTVRRSTGDSTDCGTSGRGSRSTSWTTSNSTIYESRSSRDRSSPPDDPPLEGTQVARDYWKVVAMRKRDGALAAAAYEQMVL